MKINIFLILAIILFRGISFSQWPGNTSENSYVDSFEIKLILHQKIVDAIEKGDLKKFSKYIKGNHKIDVNQRLVGGSTLLVEAVSFGKKDIVKLLLKAGADPNLRTAPFYDENEVPILDDSPLEAAIVYRTDYAIAKLLLDNGAKINETDSASTSVLQEVISGKGDKEFSGFCNEKDYPKEPPLSNAAFLEKVKWVLKNGGNVNAKNSYGETPLFNAVSRGYKDIISLLLESGARVDVISYSGRCVLHHLEDPELVKKFISLGAGVNAAANDGLTPLHFAVFSSNYEKAKILVESGADVNATDSDSRLTPLGWLVVDAYDSKIAKLLISRGAQIPEDLAKQYGMWDEIVKIKKELGKE